MAAKYLKACLGCRKVVDLFCGTGCVLAVAGTLGLASVGVELSPKRARQAAALEATCLKGAGVGGRVVVLERPREKGHRPAPATA